MSDFDGLDKTEHLGLFKPTLENVADIRSMSENMDKIDAAITADRAKYLPLTGGTLTGALKFPVGTVFNFPNEIILAADNGDAIKSSAFFLRNGNYGDGGDTAHSFYLRAGSGESAYGALEGLSNGVLKWAGSNVATEARANKFTATQTFKSEIVLANGGRILDWTAGGLYKEVCIKTDPAGNGTVLGLRAADSPKEPSTFLLRAGGDGAPVLYGTPEGMLWWNTRAVETVNSIGANFVRYQSGLQICWGLENSVTTGGRTVTFPMAFSSKPVVVASRRGDSSLTTTYGICVKDGATTTSSFLVYTSASGGTGVAWHAIGNWK